LIKTANISSIRNKKGEISVKNKETEFLLEAYSRVKLLREESSEDTNPERSFSPPSYVPMGAPDRDFGKYPIETEPKNDPYEQLLRDSRWLKKHCKDIKGLAGEKLREIAFNLEDLHNKLVRGF
jgi:hypothetical protein